MKRILSVYVVWFWFAAAFSASAASTNVAPSDAFALRRFEWIRPFNAPRVIGAQFPRDNPVFSVETMLYANGHLWAALRPRKGTNLPAGHGRLWAYSDERGLLEPVRGALEIHRVNALAADAHRLWLALNGGLASLDFSSRVVDAFGAAQGFVSADVAGVGLVEGTVVALSRYGILWGLPPGASNFVRASGAAPSTDPRSPSAWDRFATSGDWMAGVSEGTVVMRHWRGQQWITMQDEFANGSPRLTTPHFHCVAGDGEGGFWLGSDAGLHWVNPESNVVENRFVPVSVTVPGGLGMSVAPGMQPTAAAFEIARERVMTTIRDRMRDRARHTRLNAGLKEPTNPVMPTSRMPGGVTALCRDGQFLWVATTEGQNTNRSRVVLMHQATRRWIGWFSVGAPINTMAADPQRLWLGLNVTHTPGLSPLLVVDRRPLVTVPQTQWAKDAISPEELGPKLAALPVKERAVMAFFGRDPAKVVELLAPEGEPAEDADAESLFLLAFAHDLVGLNQPERLDHFVGLLRERHPNSLFTELASGVRSARPAPTAEPTPEDAVPVATPPPEAPVAPPSATVPLIPPAAEVLADHSVQIQAVLTKRDLNHDGSLNLIEFRLWLGPKADFSAADLNHDGRVDSEEIGRLLQADPTPSPP